LTLPEEADPLEGLTQEKTLLINQDLGKATSEQGTVQGCHWENVDWAPNPSVMVLKKISWIPFQT
jgi:hypothetical protein